MFYKIVSGSKGSCAKCDALPRGISCEICEVLSNELTKALHPAVRPQLETSSLRIHYEAVTFEPVEFLITKLALHILQKPSSWEEQVSVRPSI